MFFLPPLVLIFIAAFIEGGEAAFFFSVYVVHMAHVDIAQALTVFFIGLIATDYCWYWFGSTLFTLPLLRRLHPLLQNLDTRIRERPLQVAFVARFSYGLHHATLARIRHAGVSFPTASRMIIIPSLAWLAAMSGVTFLVQSIIPWSRRILKLFEVILAMVFLVIFVGEMGVSTLFQRALQHVDGLFSRVFVAEFWRDRLVVMYGLILAVLLALLVFTPTLIQHGFSMYAEEDIEVAILFILTLLSAGIYTLFMRQIRIVRDEYNRLVRHVGSLNVQTAQVDSLIRQIERLPTTKGEIKHVLHVSAMNILGTIDVPWVLIRVIDSTRGNTLTEYRAIRPGYEETTATPEIANKILLNDDGSDTRFTIIRSSFENARVCVVCACPVSRVTSEQTTIMKTAVQHATLLYHIYASHHE